MSIIMMSLTSTAKRARIRFAAPAWLSRAKRCTSARCDTPQQQVNITPITLDYGNCGQVGRDASLPSAQVERCFADAYSLCGLAELDYSPQSGDYTLQQFSIQADCVIIYTHASYQATCASAALQADGLHFSSCGTDGDVLVPALAPPATPTPTPTPGHYPGH